MTLPRSAARNAVWASRFRSNTARKFKFEHSAKLFDV
jgi:hypothetical protein